jgi:hypothetical protein
MLRATSLVHAHQPIGGEEPRAARALPAQDGQLMSQRDEFELQREATTNPEREQGNEGGQKREHADDGMEGSQLPSHRNFNAK